MKSDPLAKTLDTSAAKLLVEGSGREDIVVVALQECQAAIDAGQPIDHSAMLEKYPQIRDELSACLAGLALMHDAAAVQSDGSSSQLADHVIQQVAPTTTLGDFKIVRELGKGGMGVVYEAEQLSVGRRVALKVLPYAAMLDKRQVARFQNEARAAATLEHPNIVPVYFVGNERGVYYYAMRLIDGKNLAEVSRELRGANEGNAPPSEIASRLTGTVQSELPLNDSSEAARAETVRDLAKDVLTDIATDHGKRRRVYHDSIARIAHQLAEALDFAHSHGILHRDIKPANIMLDEVGDAWITDFGLARIESDAGMTMTGSLVGTLRYMSPEQTLAKRITVDQRSDLYSLGATLYELVALRPLFDGVDRSLLLKQIAFEAPKPLSKMAKNVPHDLETIIHKALQKNPDDRYATAKEMAEDLNRFLTNEPVRARRTPLLRRVSLWARRHPAVTTSAAVLLAVILASSAIIGLLLANHERSLRAQETESKAEISTTLEEKKGALLAANVNLNEALNAIDQFLVKMSTDGIESIPTSSPMRRDLIQSSFEIYERLEASNQMTPLLERRRLGAFVLGSEFAQNKYREQGLTLADRLLAEDPNDLFVFFSRLQLLFRRSNSNRTEFLEVTEDMFQSLKHQVDHFGSAEKMFQGPQEHFPEYAQSLAVILTSRWSYAGAPLSKDDWKFIRDVAKSLLEKSRDKNHYHLTRLAARAASLSLWVGDEQTAWELLQFAQAGNDTVPLISDVIPLIVEKEGITSAKQYCVEQLRRYELALVEYPRSRAGNEYYYFQKQLAEYLKMEPNLAGIVQELEEDALRLHPLVRRNVLLFYLHRDLGNTDQAIHYFEQERVTKFGRINHGLQSPASQLYLAKGDYDNALNAYPSNSQPHIAKRRALILYKKGLALGESKAFEQALVEMRRCLSREPSHDSLFYWHDMSAILVGRQCKDADFKEGFADLAEEALKSHSLKWYGRSRLLLAISLVGFGERAAVLAVNDLERDMLRELNAYGNGTEAEDALMVSRAFFRAAPTNPFSMNNLAWGLATSPQMDLRNLDRALELAEHAVELEPTSNCLNTLGTVLYYRKEYEESIETIKHAMELDGGDDGSNNLVLAMAHWKIGDREESREQYELAVSWIAANTPDDEEMLRFKAEASELLGIGEDATPTSEASVAE